MEMTITIIKQILALCTCLLARALMGRLRNSLKSTPRVMQQFLMIVR